MMSGLVMAHLSWCCSGRDVDGGERSEAFAGGPQAEPEGDGSDAEDLRGVGRRQPFVDGEGECFLVFGCELPPSSRHVDERGDIRRRGRGGCVVGDPHGQRGPPGRGTSGVQEAVAGDAEQPGTRAVGISGYLCGATPGHQVGVGDDIFGVVRSGTALDEAQHVGVRGVVELPEAGFKASIVSHIWYLSGRAAGVSLVRE